MISVSATKFHHAKLPIVYRYMHKEFIESFFNDGFLRIGSFLKFQSNADEETGDFREGSGAIHAVDEASHFVIRTKFQNDKSYILSTSMLNSDEIEKKFEVDSHFAIIDPFNFAIAISNAIQGFIESIQGPCIYTATRSHSQNVPGLKKQFIEAGSMRLPLLDETFDNNFHEIYFMKTLNYQHQSEYRFVWQISDYFEVSDYLDIQCKEAIQFCKKLD